MPHTPIHNEQLTSRHEAGHAVMHWHLCGIFPTIVVAGSEGRCDASGQGLTADENLLYTLAGYAAEGGCWPSEWKLDECSGGDFDHARHIIVANWRCDAPNPRPSVEEIEFKLRESFERACFILMSYDDLIDAFVECLTGKRRADPMIQSVCLSGCDALAIANSRDNWSSDSE